MKLCLFSQNCALSVREMLEGAKGDLKKKGFTEANEANAQGLRPSDGRNIYFVCILSSPK